MPYIIISSMALQMHGPSTHPVICLPLVLLHLLPKPARLPHAALHLGYLAGISVESYTSSVW